MNLTQHLTASMERGDPVPTTAQLVALCTAMHARLVDAPEMVWMNESFETLADELHKAGEIVKTPQYFEIDGQEMRLAA
jgi:hypothetical protein